MSEQVLERTMLEQHLKRIEELRRTLDTEICSLKDSINLIISVQEAKKLAPSVPLTPEQFGERIGSTGQTVRQHLDDWKLNWWKSGRRILIDACDVEKVKGMR